jgi:hypothetical protein
LPPSAGNKPDINEAVSPFNARPRQNLRLRHVAQAPEIPRRISPLLALNRGASGRHRSAAKQKAQRDEGIACVAGCVQVSGTDG